MSEPSPVSEALDRVRGAMADLEADGWTRAMIDLEIEHTLGRQFAETLRHAEAMVDQEEDN